MIFVLLGIAVAVTFLCMLFDYSIWKSTTIVFCLLLGLLFVGTSMERLEFERKVPLCEGQVFKLISFEHEGKFVCVVNNVIRDFKSE